LNGRTPAEPARKTTTLIRVRRMKTRIALALTIVAAFAAALAPAASAKPDPICTYVPDLDGHLYGPVCIGV
jgi:ABC-type sugar transport system substrate-binding protein